MNPSAKQLYLFLAACGGNWRNTIGVCRMVADPASYRRSEMLWDLSIILNEASKQAGAGGPFWLVG